MLTVLFNEISCFDGFGFGCSTISAVCSNEIVWINGTLPSLKVCGVNGLGWNCYSLSLFNR
nr:hypothetical protein [uncultured Flavobacterium sp.]